MNYNRVPEIIFWHVPSKAFRKVAPKCRIHKPCVGSINKERVDSQEAEMGIMKLLLKRSSVKVSNLDANKVYKYFRLLEDSC